MVKQVVKTADALWKVFSRISQDLGSDFERPQLVEVKDYKPPRSLSQNARLHCMIRALADFCGYSESEMKLWLKIEHGPKKRVQVGDSDKIVPMSTVDYNRAQMTAFMDAVDRTCAEQGVYVNTDELA